VSQGSYGPAHATDGASRHMPKARRQGCQTSVDKKAKSLINKKFKSSLVVGHFTRIKL